MLPGGDPVGVQSTQRRAAIFRFVADELQELKRDQAPDGARVRVFCICVDARVQRVTTAFLVTDILVVCAELFLDAQFPQCAYIQHHSYVCGAPAAGPAVAQADARVCCNTAPTPVRSAYLLLFCVTIAILSAFMLELLGLLYALRSIFFKNLLYVVDSVTIGTSLALESSLKAYQYQPTMGNLFAVVRLWRFIRIGHAILSTTKRVSTRGSHVAAVEESRQGVSEYKAQAPL